MLILFLKLGLTWALLNWKLQVFNRPKYGENINIKTWAQYTNKFYSYRDFEVWDSKNNLIAIATSKWVLIDINKQGIIKIEEDLINQYNPEEKSVFNILELPKLKEPNFSSNNFSYTAKRWDIDVNKHMHNLNYLNLAYELLPEDVYNNNELNNIEIMYKKQVKLGETVNCFYSFSENSHFVTIKNNIDSSINAIVKMF